MLSLVLVLFFPILMMSLFGTVFGDEPVFGAGPDGQGGITPAHYYLPGMLALSTILSGFQNLSSYVATERFNGTVKRLAGTPLPAASYFIGKTGQTLYLIVAQTALLLLAATVLFDVPLPREAGQWGLMALADGPGHCRLGHGGHRLHRAAQVCTKRLHAGGPAGAAAVLYLRGVLPVLPASGLAAVHQQFLPAALDGERLQVCFPPCRF